MEVLVSTKDQLTSFEGFQFPYRILPGDPKRTPIVFLSGAFQAMDSWKRFVPVFNPARTVVLADLPGMGKADHLPETYGLDFYANCTNHLLEEIDIPKVNIISASYGALMGYRFAQCYPERVSHLVLVGIMWRVSKRQREDAFAHVDQLGKISPADYATEVIDRLLTPFDRDKVVRSRLVERVLQAELKRLDEDGLQKYKANMLRLITQPPLDVESPPTSRTLIFTGEYDHFTRPRYGRALASRMQDCVFTIIEEADHLCHMERFESATVLARKFFDEEPLENIPGCKPVLRFGDSA
jgi:pimeloyl-ACP methyl ester carboxylesterase